MPEATPANITRIVQTSTTAQDVPERLEDAAAIVKVGRIMRRALEDADRGA